MSKIIKTITTQSSVDITLDNGLVISVSSNKGYVHFSFSNVKLPIRWGIVENFTFPSNNTINCFYEQNY